MSLETWGDENDNEYAHVDTLIDNGWWPSEQTAEVEAAIKSLRAEPLYENGKKDDGISVRFLARITMLEVAAGMRATSDPLAVEAAKMFSDETA